MPRRRFILVAALVLTAAGSAAGQLDAQMSGWKRSRSAHFSVVGDVSDRALRSTRASIEQFQRVLQLAFPKLRIDAPVPVTVVIFSNQVTFRPFKPRDARGRIQDTVAGYFSSRPDAIYMVMAGGVDSPEMTPIIYHEYTHFLINRSMGRVPRWVNEGLAEFYSTFHAHADGYTLVGLPSRDNVRVLSEPRMPLERLITGEIRGAGEVPRFYAQSWLLVHYLSLGDRKGQLGPYLQALDSGQTPAEAFKSTFKVSFDAMQQELNHYLRRLTLPAVRIEMPAREATGTIERLTEADAQYLQGDLLLRLRASREADERLRRALSLDADHLPAKVARARMSFDDERPNEGIDQLQAITKAVPGDFAAHYWLGNMLRRENRHTEAIVPVGRATDLNARSPHAWLELSITAGALGRNSQAEAAFTRLRQLDSDPSWFSTRAHAAFGVGVYELVARDADSYTRELGFNESGTYMAFLGTLAQWRLQRPAEAGRLLTGVKSAVPPDSWQAAVARYLSGEITDGAFLSLGDKHDEPTEAHAYVGLKAAVHGPRDVALEHLRWVKTRGARNYTEYDLSVAELRRLEAPPTSPAP
jgi:tetratricopeptide (TPR) repeat protein